MSGLNLYVEPRLTTFDRAKATDESEPDSNKMPVVNAFVGWVLRDNQTRSAVGLQRTSTSLVSKSHTTEIGKDGKRRRYEDTKTRTKISHRRHYSGIKTLKQIIVEAGVYSDIYGQWPNLARAYSPAVSVRYQTTFDKTGGKERVSRQVVWTLHLVGPRMDVLLGATFANKLKSWVRP